MNGAEQCKVTAVRDSSLTLGISPGGPRFAHASYTPQLANPANFRDNNGLSYPSQKD